MGRTAWLKALYYDVPLGPSCSCGGPDCAVLDVTLCDSQRIKIWGRAGYVEGNDALLQQVADPDYDAKLELAGHGFARA